MQQVLYHITHLLDLEIQHQGAGTSCCQHSIARGYDKECKGDFTPLCTWDPPKDLYEQMQCNSVDTDAAEQNLSTSASACANTAALVLKPSLQSASKLQQQLWVTPTAAVWAQVEIVMARILAVLQWQSGAFQTHLVYEVGLQGKDVEHYAARRVQLQTSLWQLLYDLLVGHINNMELDMCVVLRTALAPVLHAWLVSMGGNKPRAYDMSCPSRCPEIGHLARALLQRLAADKEVCSSFLLEDTASGSFPRRYCLAGGWRLAGGWQLAGEIMTITCECCFSASGLQLATDQ